MKIAPLAEVKAHFSEYLKKSVGSPVIVTKNGRPVAAIVAAPEGEAELERFILVNTPSFVNLLKKAETSIRKGKGIQHEEFWSLKTKSYAKPGKSKRIRK